MGTLVAALRLARPHAALTAAALALLGARLSLGQPPPRELLLLALAVALATAAGNALNDVGDREIDAVNKPGRPIPSGAIGAGAAAALSAAAFALALACAAMVSPWCGALCLANTGLLLAYARHSKRLGLLKDLLVGYLVGSAVLFGARHPGAVTLPAATLAACALLATVAREILKDVEDREGDLRLGSRTPPIALGVPASLAIARVCLALAVALSLVPWLLGALGGPYLPLAGLGAAVFALAVVRGRDARTAQLAVMAGSVVEMAAFYFGIG